MAKQRDLFDDTVMSFGEHLDVLRFYLFRAIIGLVIAVCVCLYFGEHIVGYIRQPIDDALRRANVVDKVDDNISQFNFFGYAWDYLSGKPAKAAGEVPANALPEKLPPGAAAATTPEQFPIRVDAYDMLTQLHQLAPQSVASPPETAKGAFLELKATSTMLVSLKRAAENSMKAVTLNVQEAFMTYLKVSFVAGLVLSSPWVFYQIWLFVAAGLYPHERKYVHVYLPFSIGLFLSGAFFCYYAVFPSVLDFLIGFNVRMGLQLQPRISEWISFAVMLPLMFGISFQLPLVMMFLAKLSIFSQKVYREQRRMAILLIAVASMILTPTQDPTSMLMMMGPMLVLYEIGILCCGSEAAASPAQTA